MKISSRLVGLGSLVGLCLTVLLADPAAGRAETAAGLIACEFLYEEASFPECHASTILETQAGLVAAWFGGTREGDQDVGIWLSRHRDGKWSTPAEIANGVESETTRHPCWNPVLTQVTGGPLVLFYKVGPSPRTWWGMLKFSHDGGATWSDARRLPESILGPIKNKAVWLPDGRLLCGSSTEHDGWRVHMEWTRDPLGDWERTKPLNDGRSLHAIQPAILQHADGQLQILCRGRGTGQIVESWSQDGGRSWSALTRIDLPNPNSGLDAVTLRDGRHLLVYNHTAKGRSPLNVAVSTDGKQWQAAIVLETEPGEFSYPAVMQTADGLVHVTYTWKRQRIRHVTLDPMQFRLAPITNGTWPAE